jgi:hypothetical protein
LLYADGLLFFLGFLLLGFLAAGPAAQRSATNVPEGP